MDGYYKEEALTNETIQNGWLHTGDEGFIDDQGFLKITGRVKDLFKTSKAKYVAPAPIEMKLSANTNIEQVCVVGSGLPQPIALVTISEYGKTKDKEALNKSLKKTLDIVNPKFEQHEFVKKIVIIDAEWTIDNNLLTPSMKIKRKEVENTYQDNYQKWYDSKGTIVS